LTTTNPWGEAMSAHPATPTEELLSSTPSILVVLAYFWAYAAVAGSAALVLGEAVATMTSAILPTGPTRIATIVALVLGAGAGQEKALVRLVRRHRH
jgi:sterol desaturase/sphingolipid hydroxylase (fatty acid hydroxylase superfamily)